MNRLWRPSSAALVILVTVATAGCPKPKPKTTDAGFDAGDEFPDVPTFGIDRPPPPNFTPQNFVANLNQAETVPLVPYVQPTAADAGAPALPTGSVTFTLTEDDNFQFHLSYQLMQPLPDAIAVVIFTGQPGVQGSPVAVLGLDAPYSDAGGDLAVTQDLINQLESDLWYVAVVTPAWPSGALRGQILPAPQAGEQAQQIFVAHMSGCLDSPPQSSSIQATAAVILSPSNGDVTYMVSSSVDGETVNFNTAGGTVFSPSDPGTSFSGTGPALGASQIAALPGGEFSVQLTAGSDTVSAPLLAPGSGVYVAAMNGAQIVPPSGSTGSGSAWIMLDYARDSIHVIGASTESDYTTVALNVGPPVGPATIAQQITDGGSPMDAGGTPADAGPAGLDASVCSNVVDAGPFTAATCLPGSDGGTAAAADFDFSSALTAAQGAAIADGFASVVVSNPEGQQMAGRVARPCESVYEGVLQPALAQPATQSTNTCTAWAYLSGDNSTVRLAFETSMSLIGAAYDSNVAGTPNSFATNLSPLGSPPSASIPTSASTAEELQLGLWRVFVSTATFRYPQSELGGQFMAPGSSLLVSYMHDGEVVPSQAMAGGHINSPGYGMVQLDSTSSVATVTSSAPPSSFASVTLNEGIAGTVAASPASSLSVVPSLGSVWQSKVCVAPSDAANLTRGLWYLQATPPASVVGSRKIRGQVIDPGDTLFALLPNGATGAQMVPQVSSSGLAEFQMIENSAGQLRFDGTIQVGSPVQVSVYQCTSGQAIVTSNPPLFADYPPSACGSGDILFSSLAPIMLTGTWQRAFASDDACLVVTTAQNRTGELRGTITPPPQ